MANDHNFDLSNVHNPHNDTLRVGDLIVRHFFPADNHRRKLSPSIGCSWADVYNKNIQNKHGPNTSLIWARRKHPLTRDPKTWVASYERRSANFTTHLDCYLSTPVDTQRNLEFFGFRVTNFHSHDGFYTVEPLYIINGRNIAASLFYSETEIMRVVHHDAPDLVWQQETIVSNNLKAQLCTFCLYAHDHHQTNVIDIGDNLNIPTSRFRIVCQHKSSSCFEKGNHQNFYTRYDIDDFDAPSKENDPNLFDAYQKAIQHRQTEQSKQKKDRSR